MPKVNVINCPRCGSQPYVRRKAVGANVSFRCGARGVVSSDGGLVYASRCKDALTPAPQKGAADG